MAKWFRGRWGRKGKKTNKLKRKQLRKCRGRRVTSSRPEQAASRLGDPSIQVFTEDMVTILIRKSNADNSSKVTMMQTSLSRLRTFLCFTEEQRNGVSVSRVKHIYDPLLWVSTRPDLLDLFIDKELVKAKGLSSSTILNWLVDLRKAVSWAVNYHRRTCGSAVPYVDFINIILIAYNCFNQCRRYTDNLFKDRATEVSIPHRSADRHHSKHVEPGRLCFLLCGKFIVQGQGRQRRAIRRKARSRAEVSSNSSKRSPNHSENRKSRTPLSILILSIRLRLLC